MCLHGDRDEIVPYRIGKKLFEGIQSGPKEMVTIRGAHHNDIVEVDPPLYLESVRKFLAAFVPTPKA